MKINAAICTVFDWFGGDELMECYHSLDLDETHVRCLSPYAIKTVALDRFKCSLLEG